jgi:hypothetical protein
LAAAHPLPALHNPGSAQCTLPALWLTSASCEAPCTRTQLMHQA